MPLVSVKLNCGAGNKAALHLTQSRALPLGSPGSAPQLWQIPVCVNYGDDAATHHQCMLLTESSADMELKDAKTCPAWVEANAGGEGYYFTRYEDGLLAKLLVDHGPHLSAAERLSDLGDLQALNGMGEVPTGEILGLALDFASDPARQVVEMSANIIGGIHDHLLPADLKPNYARLVEKAFGSRARALGWQAAPGETADTRLLRVSIVPLVALWGSDDSLAAQARRLAGSWLHDRTAIDPDVTRQVLTVAARTGREQFFEDLKSALSKTEDRQQRELILGAIGSFNDRTIARASMQLALAPGFDLREVSPLLYGPAGSPATMDLPFEFVKANYDAIAARIPAGSTFGLGENLPAVGSNFCDEKSAADLKAFFAPKVDRFAGTRRNLAQVLEVIRLCVAYKDAQQQSVVDFLRKY